MCWSRAWRWSRYYFCEAHIIEVGSDRLPRVGESHYPLYFCRMGIRWSNESACGKEAIIRRIVGKAGGLIVADFIARTVFALIPGDLQRNSPFVDTILNHPSTKGRAGSRGDTYCLINVSLRFAGDKDSGLTSSMGFVYVGQKATVTLPASGTLLEAWVL